MDSTFEKLGGEIRYLRRLVDKEDKLWSAFNPSIGINPFKGYGITFRSSNYVILPHGELATTYGDKIRNRVWFADLDDDLELQNLRQIDFSRSGYDLHRGVEDAKLLSRDGKWMFTAVAMERDIPMARYCECYLDKDATFVESIVMYEGVNAMKPEKNWMTANYPSPHFDYVYNGNGIVKDGKVIMRLLDNKDLAGLRGNTHLLDMGDGTYIAVMHKLLVSRGKQKFLVERQMYTADVQKDYYHYFVRINEYGWIIEMSEPFRFVSKGIEFAAGIIEKDGHFVVSFGKDDVSSHLAIIDKKKVLKLLKKIDSPS